MIRRLIILAAVCALAAPAAETLTLPGKSPLVSFRILFKTGAAHDPKGKEGVAQLTASMLSGAGSKAQTYDQIVDAFFPMAASFGAQVDKEMTVFSGTTHVENLDKYYAIIRPMLLEPGWREEDFRRIKDETLNALRIGLRSNNEEELGKEYLYQTIYEGGPYAHPDLGLGKAIEALTLDDIKAFYADQYRRGNVVIGLAGGYPAGFDAKVAKDFDALPEGAPAEVELPQPAKAKKLRVHILEKDTRSTLISIGFPIDVTRADPDWPALKVMQSYFGQHRSSKSHLFQRIREVRGMNYGDYAYIEYFPRGMYQFQPDPNLARRRQIFQIWIRPVVPENGMFALRLAMFELDKLVRKGLTQEQFDSTREFLSKFVNLLTQTANDELGYELDSEYYGIGDFNGWFKGKLNGLSRDAVNQAIQKHLRSSDLDIVVITKDAAAFKRALQSGAASKPVYASAPAADVLAEDKLVGAYKLDLGEVTIVPADSVFE
ncbi:MAG: insulinase family protein [Acidobacteria bacterium]|nr:insulinase family protein [Acidobacteriota bacterium]